MLKHLMSVSKIRLMILRNKLRFVSHFLWIFLFVSFFLFPLWIFFVSAIIQFLLCYYRCTVDAVYQCRHSMPATAEPAGRGAPD